MPGASPSGSVPRVAVSVLPAARLPVSVSGAEPSLTGVTLTDTVLGGLDLRLSFSTYWNVAGPPNRASANGAPTQVGAVVRRGYEDVGSGRVEGNQLAGQRIQSGNDRNAGGIHQRDGSIRRRTGHDAVVSSACATGPSGSVPGNSVPLTVVSSSVAFTSGAVAGFGGMSKLRTLIVTVAVLPTAPALSVSW